MTDEERKAWENLVAFLKWQKNKTTENPYLVSPDRNDANAILAAHAELKRLHEEYVAIYRDRNLFIEWVGEKAITIDFLRRAIREALRRMGHMTNKEIANAANVLRDTLEENK